MKTLQEIKDSVAQSKGYPDWESMENWVIDSNKFTVVVGQLLVGAMDEAAELYASQYINSA